MKIRCHCGYIISDSTDFLRNKACFVADQDDEDGYPHLYGSDELMDLQQTIWRCAGCGRLAFDTPGGLAWFTPDDELARGEVLRSVHGDAWRGHLRGHWRDGAGHVWWNTNVDEDYKTFSSEEEVRACYHERFGRLREHDRLRDAFLRVEGVMLHRWSHEP